MKLRIFATLWLAIISLMADEPVPSDVLPSWEYKGRTYQNVKIQTLREFDAILHYDDGLLRVKLSDLPEPWKSRYYSAGKTEHLEHLAALKKEYEPLIRQIPLEQLKEKTCRVIDGTVLSTNQLQFIEGRVLKKFPNAILVHTITTTSASEKVSGAEIYVLCGEEVAAGLAKDADFICYALKTSKTYDYKNFLGMVTSYDLYDMGTPYVSEILRELAAVKLYPLPPELMQKAPGSP